MSLESLNNEVQKKVKHNQFHTLNVECFSFVRSVGL